MLMKVYTVFDVKAGAYLQPFFAPTDGVAGRMVERAVNSEGHQFFDHPEDFKLFRLGEWDEHEGVLTGEPPVHVLDCHMLMAEVQRDIEAAKPRPGFERGKQEA